MGETIDLINLNRPAHLIADELGDGGVDVWVYWWLDDDVSPLFSFTGVPTPRAIALASAISERWKTNAELRESFISYALNIGSAVHSVDRPKWEMRTLTEAEAEAIRRDRLAHQPAEEECELINFTRRPDDGGDAA